MLSWGCWSPSTSCTSRRGDTPGHTSPPAQCGTGAWPGGRSTAGGGWTDTAVTPAAGEPGDTGPGQGEGGRCKQNVIMIKL